MSPLERESALCCWLQQSVFGGYLTQITQTFVADKLCRAPLPTILKLGRMPLALSETERCFAQYLFQSVCADGPGEAVDVVAAYDALPWATQSINTVLWPHGLEVCAAAAPAVLRELHRVLAPGGQVILTGLNALGYWRLRHGRAVWLRGVRYHNAHSVHALFQAQGFHLSEAQFMAYRVHAVQAQSSAPLELMGNRWWPHLAALYGCVYTKQAVVLTPQRQINTALGKRDRLDWEAATRHDCTG